MRRFAILGVAGALALAAAAPVSAAPLSNAVDLKAAATDTTQVRWRGRGYGWHRGHSWVPGAVVGGLAAGAIIGSQAYRADPYYYGGYAYDPYPYGGAYAYSPGYFHTRRSFFGLDRDCIGEYDSAGVRC